MNKSAPFFALGALVVLALTAGAVAAFVVMADDSGPPEHPDEAGFRAFVPKLQAALNRGDVKFFAGRLLTTPITCTAQDLAAGPGGPQCETAGESYDGFVLARWQSEGSIVPATSIVQQVQKIFDTQQAAASDAFGDGKPRVYALDFAGDKYHAILTALVERPPSFFGTGPLRIAVGTAWTFQERRWRLASVLNAYISGEDFLVPCKPGLDFLGGAWERYPDPQAAGPGPEHCPGGQ